ncbi:MAG TPA: HIRAN domain-containing protein [Prolixibacteraceae bacterium]|jgi:hypothetical protein
MNRIDFLKQLVLGCTLLFVPKHSSENTPRETREIKFITPYIAGFQYYQGLELEQRLKENETLSLKREPQNRHDYNAIEVFRGDHKLGYIPRAENKLIARVMDQGMTVKASITRIDPEAIANRRVKMKVFYEMVQDFKS